MRLEDTLTAFFVLYVAECWRHQRSYDNRRMADHTAPMCCVRFTQPWQTAAYRFGTVRFVQQTFTDSITDANDKAAFIRRSSNNC